MYRSVNKFKSNWRWLPYFALFGIFGLTLHSYIPTHSQSRFEQAVIDREINQISEYDAIIYRHARASQLDWRLVASMIFVESSFREKAVSPAGAFGLMQLMPVVAREQGIHHSSHKPEDNIRAGINHFRKKMNRIKGVTPEDELALSLAAYNAGLGHLRDAQRLSRSLGKSTRKWKDVREAFLLLERPEIYENVEFGYCRGSETVEYVSRVVRKYQSLRDQYPAMPNYIAESNSSHRAQSDS